MRRFEMTRQGHVVADGVEWGDKTVVLRWRGETPSTAVYSSIEMCQAVHGHDATEFAWLDHWYDGKPRVLEPMCVMCHGGPPADRGQHCIDCGAMGSIIYLPPDDIAEFRRRDKFDVERSYADRREMEYLRSMLPIPLGAAVERVRERQGLLDGERDWWAREEQRCGSPLWRVSLGRQSQIMAAITSDEALRAGVNRLSWLRADSSVETAPRPSLGL
jgi:hypothetical protein